MGHTIELRSGKTEPVWFGRSGKVLVAGLAGTAEAARGTSVRFRFGGSFLSLHKLSVVCGRGLVPFMSPTINETFKWLSSLPI